MSNIRQSYKFDNIRVKQMGIIFDQYKPKLNSTNNFSVDTKTKFNRNPMNSFKKETRTDTAFSL